MGLKDKNYLRRYKCFSCRMLFVTGRPLVLRDLKNACLKDGVQNLVSFHRESRN